MVCKIYLFASVVISLGYSEEVYESRYCSDDSRPSDTLAFVNPHPHRINVFPIQKITLTKGQKSLIRCCGTGFTSIEWYHNDEVITDTDTKFLTNIDHGQVLLWIDPSPPGYSNISCQLIKDANTSLLHHIDVYVENTCKEKQPEHTIVPRDECASPGDTITFWCEMFFGPPSCIHPFFRAVVFKDDNNLFINSMKRPHLNIEYVMTKSDDQATSILANLTFHNITEAQLASTYYCMPQRLEHMKVAFTFAGPCAAAAMSLVRTTQVHQSIADISVALPVAVTFCITVMAAICIYKCRKRMRLVWYNHINPTKKGKCEYDAYVLCSNNEHDQLFLVECLLPQLEKYYTLCIPDRDFCFGSVIPAEMSEYIKRCKRVLVVSSNSLLQTDYCDLSLSVAISNNIPLIFVQSNNQSEDQEGFHKVIGNSPTLSDAFSMSKFIIYPTKNTNLGLASFYDSLYQAMPLAASTV